MKKLIITITAILLLPYFVKAGGTTTTAGTTPAATVLPSSIPMKRDQVISRMLTQVKHLEVSVYASSILYSSSTVTNFNTDYLPVCQPKTSEILALLGSKQLVYNLADPKSDWVYLYAYYYDANWQPVFFGGTGFQLEKGSDGKWVTPTGANQVVLFSNDQNYKVAGINQAYFVERDSNGNQIGWYSLNVDYQNGSFTFPFNLENRVGELYISYIDPVTGQYATVAYDSETSKQIVPVGATTTASGKFDSVQTIVPVGRTITPALVQSYQGVGNSDVIEVEITANGAGWYTVVEQTTENELPTTVRVWSISDTDAVPFTRTSSSLGTSVWLKAGINHITFDWPSLKSPNIGTTTTTTPAKG